MQTEAKNLLDQYEQLSDSAKQDFDRQVGIPEPSSRASDALWKIVISAFSLVLLGSFATVAYGMFRSPPEGASVKPELILAMFTSVVGFLGGVFVPSPAGKKGR